MCVYKKVQTMKTKNLSKKPEFLVIIVSLFFILISILTVMVVSSKLDLDTFNWNGVSGISDVLMTLVTVVLLLSIWQAKDAHNESTMARVQSTNASDAEVLRWAMDEMGKRKPHIKLVTNAYKMELEKILIENHNYNNQNISDRDKDLHRTKYIKNLDEEAQKDFFADVKNITGKDWDKDIITALHTEVSIIMQRMGYMALFGLISKQHFINLWGPMFLASWYSLEWYIKEERERLEENTDEKKHYEPAEFIKKFGGKEDNRSYEGAYFRIHLETFIKECEAKLPLKMVNNERLKFGRPPL